MRIPLIGGRLRALAALCAFGIGTGAGSASAQDVTRTGSQSVTYQNPADETELTAELTLPSGPAPHPGIVLFSVAGTTGAVDRWVAEGYAVLTPTLRGFVAVEPLLRAGFSDLAGDVGAALAYLGSRPEVDASALALVAQADNAPPALLFAAESGRSVPLVLMAPPAFPGVEAFRLEQRWIAEGAGWGVDERAALDRYIDRIAEIVLGERAPYAREYRLQGLRTGSAIDLPPNAAFPSDGRQAHFFASPLWHDRLAFDPEVSLAALTAPVLVLIGTEDPYTPLDAYEAALERGLAASGSRDATVCRIEGRTRHTFSSAGVGAVTAWLAGRVGAAGPIPGSAAEPPSECLDRGGG